MANLSEYFKGWRSGLALATIAAAIVTLFNIVFLAVSASLMEAIPGQEYEGILFQGSCSRAKELSTWSHAVINILGSLLLATGNFTQQVLTSPTREEIDRSHAKKEWLHIGTPSSKNLTRIARKRVLVWTFLGLCSLPIHLFYNSVISFEYHAETYGVFTMTDDCFVNKSISFEHPRLNTIVSAADRAETLSAPECISAYKDDFLFKPGRSDVILVTKPRSSNGTRAFTSSLSECQRQTQQPTHVCELMGGPECSAWIPLQGSDSYCVSRSLEEQCNLVMDTRFLAIVIGCNLLKLLGLAATWLCLKKRPLLTIGGTGSIRLLSRFCIQANDLADAMESFLTQPDTTTQGCGLMCISFFNSPEWNDQPKI
ncbi:hypothetical protein CGCSCA5_v002509 [Colletotrichum siamense]|nr:hypothetical protein CGCSCA5_v002509 [Colletotrichum siamense]